MHSTELQKREAGDILQVFTEKKTKRTQTNDENNFIEIQVHILHANKESVTRPAGRVLLHMHHPKYCIAGKFHVEHIFAYFHSQPETTDIKLFFLLC